MRFAALRIVTRSVNEPLVGPLPVLRSVQCTVAGPPDWRLPGVTVTIETMRSGATFVVKIGCGGTTGLGTRLKA